MTKFYVNFHVGDFFRTFAIKNKHTDMRLRNIMFAGTGSDVGKSVIAAAFCRIFRQDGSHPAPFKAQNMALNSYATPDGLEIGRAQAAQAEAACIDCHVDMNPVLLKPQSDHTSQVVVNGRPIGNRDAWSYFRGEGNDWLRKEVCDAFDRLAAKYSPIVMEGAGSISELNLRDRDIVNMPMARHADADVILVGDIDRGGVFASLYGSVMLQTPEDRQRIKGIIINKFRGDIRLFDDGRKMIEQICHVPVLAVVPYLDDIGIEEEDSVQLACKNAKADEGKKNVAVVKLRHLSNFTDFKAMEQDHRINVYYTTDRQELLKADVIILPGSKATISDLRRLHDDGVVAAIREARQRGITILGICGGYQMMGISIDDPRRSESDTIHIDGMGLLPIRTVMGDNKITCQSEFTFADGVRSGTCDEPKEMMKGYEIHVGISTIQPGSNARPLTVKADGEADGCFVDSRCMGTYLHGCLDNGEFVSMILGEPTANRINYSQYKEYHFNRLADHVRRHTDMERLYDILKRK